MSNTNPRAIDYIVNHVLEFDAFCWQYNKGAIDFLLEHPEHRTSDFCNHDDERVVDYYLEHPEEINIDQWVKNKHPKAVAFTIEYLLPYLENYQSYQFACNPGLLRRSICDKQVKEWTIALSHLG